MSRFEIGGLALGVVVVVGWDRVLGFFCEVRRPGQPHAIYDRTMTEDGTSSIAGVLHTLIAARVIEGEDVAEAERWVLVGDVEDIPASLVGARVAAEVIVHLRQAAGR